MSSLEKKHKVKKSPIKNQYYQVDYSQKSIGKHISATKHKIDWKFGIIDKESMSSNHAGVDCRGEEHEVSLTWSFASGKRLITLNGMKMLFSCYGEGRLQYSWTMRGSTFTIIGHSNQKFKPARGWHQFNLFIDGKSFYKLPKIYEIGCKTKPKSSSLWKDDDGKFAKEKAKFSFISPLRKMRVCNYTEEMRSREDGDTEHYSNTCYESMRKYKVANDVHDSSLSPSSVYHSHDGEGEHLFNKNLSGSFARTESMTSFSEKSDSSEDEDEDDEFISKRKIQLSRFDDIGKIKDGDTLVQISNALYRNDDLFCSNGANFLEQDSHNFESIDKDLDSEDDIQFSATIISSSTRSKHLPSHSIKYEEIFLN